MQPPFAKITALSPQASNLESERSGEILYGGMVSDPVPTSSRIVGEDSELLSWQREAAQTIK